MRALLVAVVMTAVCVPITAHRPAEGKTDEASRHGRTVSEWRADLTHAEPTTRFNALVALGAIGPDADVAVKDVTALLEDPHPQVRERAAGTLGALGPKGYDAVIATLESPEAAMRAIACDVLTFGDPPRRKAAAALRRRLDDSVSTVRYLAAFALTVVEPKGEAALPVLQEALGTANAPAVIGACEAAARLGHRARPLLRALLGVFKYIDEKALVAAGKALRGLDPSIVPRLAARAGELAVNPGGQMVLLGVIADLGKGDAAAARVLMPFLRDANGQVTLAAADALRTVDVRGPNVVRALEALALRSDDPARAELATKAFEVLAGWEVPLSEPLTRALQDAVARRASPETYGTLLADAPRGLAVFARVLDTEAPVEHRVRWLRGLVAAARVTEAAAVRTEARRVVLRVLEAGPPVLRAYAAESAPVVFKGDAAIVETLALHAALQNCPVCARVAAETLVGALEEHDPWHTADASERDVVDPAPWRAAGFAIEERLGALVEGDDVRASLAARIARAYLRPKDPAAVRGCLEALASMDLSLRRTAAACLATIRPGTTEVVQALARVMANRTENPVVRRTAAVALARQGAKARELIADRIRSSGEAERQYWLVALGRVGPALAALLPVVVEDLEADGDAVRDAAIEAIGAMEQHAAAIGPQVAALLTKRAYRRRAAGMRALAAMRDTAAPWVPAMLDAVAKEPRGARARFAGWLVDVGPAAVPALAKAVAKATDWERQLVLLNLLGRLGPPAASATPQIAKLLDAPDSSVRVAACELLALLGTDASDALLRLIPRLGDPVGRVRVAAVDALVAIGARQDTFKAALVQMGNEDAHAFVRKAARAALSGMEREDDR